MLYAHRQTTERSYISVETDQSAERFDALITRLKTKVPLRRSKPPARGKRRPYGRLAHHAAATSWSQIR
jgi:hypothetical protein